MKNLIRLLILLLTFLTCEITKAQVQMNFNFDTPYGDNQTVGKHIKINGTKIYYEEYGAGEPLLLIHGNGGSIKLMGNQIDYFKTKYRVIIADSRGQGKSELNTDSLTYDLMAKDYDELVSYLKLDSVSIIGWSDGGIISLKMGILTKSKIRKIVTMGANLRPDSTALLEWNISFLKNEKELIESKIEEKDTTQNWLLLKQLNKLCSEQPNISTSDLSKIKAKVLIMAGDKDIVRGEHTIEIFRHISNAQLCIMPGETHFAPASNPKLFNETINTFLSEPFKRPDSNWTKW